MDTYKLKGLRERLIEKIRQEGGVQEAVLEAMLEVQRHRFLESAFAEAAYDDRALPIADGQTISQPRMVAVQSSLLELKKGMKVLEIGTGSGYQAAVLCQMGAKVFTVERIRSLQVAAQKILNDLGYKLRMKWGDGTDGWPAHAPYDRIIVTAGAPSVPEVLLKQLADGGKMVIPVGGRESQELLVIDKIKSGEYQRKVVADCAFVPMIGKHGWQANS